MILNPWDVQSKQIHTTDGVASTLYAGTCRWGGNEMYVLVEVKNEEDSDNPKRSGGAVMSWNYNGLAATLRAEMSSSHPPIVVLKNDEAEEDTQHSCV